MILQEVKWSLSVWAKSSAKRVFLFQTFLGKEEEFSPSSSQKRREAPAWRIHHALTPTLQKEMI